MDIQQADDALISVGHPIESPHNSQLQLLETLRNLHVQAEIIQRDIAKIVRELRRSGVPWGQVAECVGISPQAAYQKWSEKGNEKHRQRQQARRAKAPEVTE